VGKIVAFGLRIRNDTGTVQIDENWRNYGFLSKFSVPITLDIYTTQVYTFNATGEALLVAARMKRFHLLQRESTFDGTNWMFRWMIFPDNTAPFPPNTATDTIDFFLFDVPKTSSFSNIGLRVRNSAGQAVYHSDMGMMKIVAVQPCNVPFVGVPGRSYAPFFVLNPIRVDGSRHYTRSLHVDGHIITPQSFGPISVSLASSVSNEGLYGVIDVTGL
jgi:hypothetical protein